MCLLLRVLWTVLSLHRIHQICNFPCLLFDQMSADLNPNFAYFRPFHAGRALVRLLLVKSSQVNFYWCSSKSQICLKRHHNLYNIRHPLSLFPWRTPLTRKIKGRNLRKNNRGGIPLSKWTTIITIWKICLEPFQTNKQTKNKKGFCRKTCLYFLK